MTPRTALALTALCLIPGACTDIGPIPIDDDCSGSLLLDDPDLIAPRDPLVCETSWTEAVPAPTTTWTVEFGREANPGWPALVATPEGLIVGSDNQLLNLDRTSGARTWGPVELTTTPTAHNIAGLSDGSLVVGDRFGQGDIEYLVFDGRSGQQLDQEPLGPRIWGLPPMLAPAGERVWVGVYGVSNDTGAFRVRRYDPADASYEVEVEVLGEVFAENFAAMAFDGQGRLALVGDNLYILDVETGVASIHDLAVSIPRRLVGYDDGWAVTGWLPKSMGVVRFDGGGEVLWRFELRDATHAQGLDIAPLPDGRLVVGGTESFEGQSSRPVLMILDRAGKLVAGERIDAEGRCTGAAVGPEGEVYIAGTAEVERSTGGTEQLRWVRRYDP